MTSTRFPGKTLAPFLDSTLLEHILGRLKGGRHPVDIRVATSTEPSNDPIVEACDRAGVPVGRGPELDVLARFAQTIEAMPERPDVVVRLCADRPFVGTSLVDDLLDAYFELGEPDLLANNRPPSYPYGLDLEVMKMRALLEAAAESSDPYEREHVTPFLERRPERYRVVNLTCPFGNFSQVRVVVDTPADYEAMQVVGRRLRELDPRPDHRDLLNLYAVEPELFATSP